MKHDPLCKYFKNLRNDILKKGISGIEAVSTEIETFDSSKDIPKKPKGVDDIVIGKRGIFFSVHSKTPKADIIPADTNAKMSTVFILKDVPDTHLGNNITDKNFFEVSKLYYEYLKSLVEECTGIVNKSMSN